MFEHLSKVLFSATVLLWTACPSVAGDLRSDDSLNVRIALTVQDINPGHLPLWFSNISYGKFGTQIPSTPLPSLVSSGSYSDFSLPAAGVELGVVSDGFRVSAFGGLASEVRPSYFTTTFYQNVWTIGATLEFNLGRSWTAKAQYFAIEPDSGCSICSLSELWSSGA